MKALFFAAAALAISAPAVSQSVYVHGYTTKNGTYVAPHYRSAPDHSVYNNWSTTGNVNPYTGQAGTRNPYSSYRAPSYGTYQAPSYQVPSYTYPSYGSTDSDSTDSSDPY